MKRLNICNAIVMPFLCTTGVANVMSTINLSDKSTQVLDEMSTYAKKLEKRRSLLIIESSDNYLTLKI